MVMVSANAHAHAAHIYSEGLPFVSPVMLTLSMPIPYNRTFWPRKFFCTEKTTSACRRGFLSQSGLTHHRHAIHPSRALQELKHCQKLPKSVEYDSNVPPDPQTTRKPAYQQFHPLIDGKYNFC